MSLNAEGLLGSFRSFASATTSSLNSAFLTDSAFASVDPGSLTETLAGAGAAVGGGAGIAIGGIAGAAGGAIGGSIGAGIGYGVGWLIGTAIDIGSDAVDGIADGVNYVVDDITNDLAMRSQDNNPADNAPEDAKPEKREIASEKYVLDIARRIERELGVEARDELHDLKDTALGDRTKSEVLEDARAIYENAGREMPQWLLDRLN